jgi:hypothetical protein
MAIILLGGGLGASGDRTKLQNNLIECNVARHGVNLLHNSVTLCTQDVLHLHGLNNSQLLAD